jgi:hypothetical protein
MPRPGIGRLAALPWRLVDRSRSHDRDAILGAARRMSGSSRPPTGGGSIDQKQPTKGMPNMSSSAINTPTGFTIDSATLVDKNFQLKLEKFVSEASDRAAFVAANGQWSPKSSD